MYKLPVVTFGAININPRERLHASMVNLLIQGRTEAVLDGETIEDAVRRLGMHPDSYLYVIEGRPVPMDIIPHGDVKILRVASGG